MKIRYVLLAGVTIALALGPPLHEPAEELFSAHMAQHLVLVTVAGPLLAIGLPRAAAVVALMPRTMRRTLGNKLHAARRLVPRARRAGTGLIAAWLLHVGVLWIWHAPALYEAALRAPLLHGLEHASLLATATVFWMTALPRRRERAPGAAVAHFAAAGQSTALGALLTLTAVPSYWIHQATVARWGLTLLEDQQLAGLIMWTVGGLGYLGAALVVLTRLVRQDGTMHDRAIERPTDAGTSRRGCFGAAGGAAAPRVSGRDTPA